MYSRTPPSFFPYADRVKSHCITTRPHHHSQARGTRFTCLSSGCIASAFAKKRKPDLLVYVSYTSLKLEPPKSSRRSLRLSRKHRIHHRRLAIETSSLHGDRTSSTAPSVLRERESVFVKKKKPLSPVLCLLERYHRQAHLTMETRLHQQQ